MSLRIGHGYDLHRLVPGRPFVIGGVEIPSERGPIGHSDGDALVHAVIDALLGAAGLGDIGMHFPDTDPAWSGVAGSTLISEALPLVDGYHIVNVDTTIIVEQPKIAPHREAIRRRLAQMLSIEVAQVNVKAKTNEGCDATGAGDAIACFAVVLLEEEQSEAWL